MLFPIICNGLVLVTTLAWVALDMPLMLLTNDRFIYLFNDTVDVRDALASKTGTDK
jgi:hypothetical protein